MIVRQLGSAFESTAFWRSRDRREWLTVVMGWTPPDGIDVPEWRC